MIIYSDHETRNEIIPSNYSLFLDDIRKPLDVKIAWHDGYTQEFPSLYNWVIVRSFNEFIDCIKQYHLPSRVSYDHDLSFEHYPTKGNTDISNTTLPYDSYKEKTGYHCAKWLVDYCYTNELDIPEFYVHSFNPVGRMNIVNYLVRSKEILAALRNPKKEA